MSKRRTRRIGRSKKDYQRERVNSDGKDSITIWGFVKLKDRDAKHIGYTNQEGKFSRLDNHAEARWAKTHLNKLKEYLSANKRLVEQIEFDVTTKPCVNCSTTPLPAIRAAVTAVMGDNGETPIFVFVDTKNNFTFDSYLEVPATGAITGTPTKDV